MDGLKVGVGMITGGKREIPHQIHSNSSGDVFIYHDVNHDGPATARNKVLSHFKGYDYVFIFDDDCYPEHGGYEKYFIQHAMKHNVHWMGVPRYFDNEIHHIEGEMAWWTGGLGAFQFLSKHALETIGGYNTAYDFYGWEDIGIEARARRAGLTGKYQGSAFPVRGMSYIRPLDMFGNPANQAYTSIDEKKMYANKNHHLFEMEAHGSQLFYPYE